VGHCLNQWWRQVGVEVLQALQEEETGPLLPWV